MPPTFNYTGQTQFPRTDSSLPVSVSEFSNGFRTLEINSISLPLLLNLSWKAITSKNLDFNLHLSHGGYVVFLGVRHSILAISQTNGGGLLAGDTFENEANLVYWKLKPITEFKPELSIKVGEALILKMFGEFGYLRRFRILVDSRQTGAGSNYGIYHEFGGKTYGGGLGLNLNF